MCLPSVYLVQSEKHSSCLKTGKTWFKFSYSIELYDGFDPVVLSSTR